MSPPVPVAPLRGLSSYSVPKSPWPIDLPLAANEGPAPPRALLDALSDPEIVRRYPSRAPLAEALAARLEIPRDQLLVTAGADEGLERGFRAFLQPGDEVILPRPTFVMLPHYARLLGVAVVAPDWPAEEFPTEAVLAALTAPDSKVRAVVLVTPNNPTGAVISRDAIATIARAAPEVAILVDLAYVETADEDPTRRLVAAHDNVLVFRTLSKAWGLAGLRVGYVVSHPATIAVLTAAGPPYSVPAPSVALALAHLAHGEPGMRAYVEAVRHEREVLYEILREGGARPVRSQANFTFARFASPAAALAFRDGLAQRGIGVRAFPNHPYVADGVRITCPGDPGQLARLEGAMREVLGRAEASA